MNQKNIGIVSGVVIGVIISVILVYTQLDNVDENVQSGQYEGWINSGPFQINKQQYKLGELVFLSVNGLNVEDNGNIIFMTPNSVQYQTIPFDGRKKTDFNQYFKPTTSRALKICSIDDLVGEWTVIFQGVALERLNFEIIEEYVPGEEKRYPKIC